MCRIRRRRQTKRSSPPCLLLHRSSFLLSSSSVPSAAVILFLFSGFTRVHHFLFYLHNTPLSLMFHIFCCLHVMGLLLLPVTPLFYPPNCLYMNPMTKHGKKCHLILSFLSFLTFSFSYLPSQIFSLHRSLSVLLLFWQQTDFCLVSAYPCLVNNRAQVAPLSDH